MKTMMKSKSIYWVAAFLFSMAACQKEEMTTGNEQDTYINFYNASEVLQQYMTYSGENLVIVNDTLWDNLQPTFSPTDDFRQFPRHFTASDAVIDNARADVYWLPMMADTYRFTYTSVDRTALKDTTVNLLPKTFTTQYLVESPQGDQLYRVLTVPVERRGTAGKARIQVLNLSPDFGPLEVYRTDQSGNRILSDLPTDLKFGEYSAYAELDTTGTSATYGKLMLQFCKSGGGDAVLTKAVEANPNSTYTLVFQGFEKETPRRIRIDDEQYGQVTVSPNLRVNVRRTY